MSDIALCVEGLGKRYRLGATQDAYGSLRETVSEIVKAPVRLAQKVARRNEGETSRRPTFWALKDVNFEVKKGESLGIIGRNGAGKSTLLKLLSEITEPTEGRVVIQGRVASLLEVGTGFHPELSGRENIFLNGAILGMSRREIAGKFDEIVAFAEVEKFIDTQVKHYSSGMYLRLAFAVAAHLEPEILVVDEVLAVGDAAFQKKCLGRMGEVAGEGRTVLFVSHNMAAVTELAQRTIVLDAGRIVAEGPTVPTVTAYLAAQGGASEGCFDISSQSLRRNSLSDTKFKWLEMSFVNSAGVRTASIQYQEPFEIRLQCLVTSGVHDLRASLAVHSALGYPIFNSFQSDTGLSSSLPAGVTEYTVRIDPNILAPGLYEVGLGANGPGVIDWLPTAGQFTISAVGRDGATVWEGNRGGIIRYPCIWSSTASISDEGCVLPTRSS